VEFSAHVALEAIKSPTPRTCGRSSPRWSTRRSRTEALHVGEPACPRNGVPIVLAGMPHA
jgi:hypothetical protein